MKNDTLKNTIKVTDCEVKIGKKRIPRDKIAELVTQMLSIYDWVAPNGMNYFFWAHGYGLWIGRAIDTKHWVLQVQYDIPDWKLYFEHKDFEETLKHSDLFIDEIVAKHEPGNTKRSQHATSTIPK